MLFGWVEQRRDSLTVSLLRRAIFRNREHQYPGRRLDGYFSTWIPRSPACSVSDPAVVTPISCISGQAKGRMYFHLAPLTFYQLISCCATVTFIISPTCFRLFRLPPVRWSGMNIFFKKDTDRTASHSLSNLLSILRFERGVLMALLTLLVYTLMEMRRKQRHIPVVRPPAQRLAGFCADDRALVLRQRDPP